MTEFKAIDQFPDETQKELLMRILRGRRRYYFVQVNFNRTVFRRNDLRDYLKKKFPGVTSRHT
jgi:hypothetical protein